MTEEIPNYTLDDFDYDLPEELIAQTHLKIVIRHDYLS
ncbi:Uncharacterised protein [Weissella viridescens]|uniref:Uncharacterized protein n=1 Tax=Weissella viridescens TaxID=1629 RepID=A0A380P8C8_WEIVI|nr:Uncharacterised protein [Weissella viridescens]